MRTAKQGMPVHRRNRLVLLGLVSTGLLLVGVFTLMPQLLTSDNGEPSASTEVADQRRRLSPTTSSTIEVGDEVVGRLLQIFRVRDRAIETRNALLLEGIYTPDCPCLEGDEELIERLKREQLVWRGIKVSLDIQKVEKVNDQLWTVSALVTTSPYSQRVGYASPKDSAGTGGFSFCSSETERPEGLVTWAGISD